MQNRARRAKRPTLSACVSAQSIESSDSAENPTTHGDPTVNRTREYAQQRRASRAKPFSIDFVLRHYQSVHGTRMNKDNTETSNIFMFGSMLLLKLWCFQKLTKLVVPVVLELYFQTKEFEWHWGQTATVQMILTSRACDTKHALRTIK